MKRSIRILLGSLGMAHLLIAIVLLPVAMFLGFFSIPVIIPGLIWIAVLGVRLLRPGARVRTALRTTHAVLAPLAVLLVAYGLHCLQAASRSAEGGGGLLGAAGLIPIIMGTLVGCLSAVSLCIAFSSALPKKAKPNNDSEASLTRSRAATPERPKANLGSTNEKR